MINQSEFQKLGFCRVEFHNTKALTAMQELIKNHFKSEPTQWHLEDAPLEMHIELVKKVTEEIVNSNLCRQLAFDNLSQFTSLFGPDIEIQTWPHLRVARPEREDDAVDWHRDTFYGNTPWEINLWFPLFDLQQGAGLLLLPGSHVVPSENIRKCEKTSTFKSNIKRGSSAHQVGYNYDPKTDDTIANLDTKKLAILNPKVGEAILFFGCMVHKAQNYSKATRISLDLRLRSLYTPTDTKEGYYQPLCRGIIETSAKKFLKRDQGKI